MDVGAQRASALGLQQARGAQAEVVGGKVTFVALGSGSDKGKIGFGS